ncbi:MAG: DUF4168 domain-containing protein [Pseudomonadota bacterium]
MSARHRFAALIAALGLAAGAAALPVAAQQSGGSANSAAGAPIEVSDEKLAVVAEVMAEIEQIRDRYRSEIENTDDPEQQQQLIREGNREMAATVEETPDISVEELNAVLEAASVDDELRARLDEEIQKHDG